MMCRTCAAETLHVRALETRGPWVCRPCATRPERRRSSERREKPRPRRGRRVEDLTSYDEIVAEMDAVWGPEGL